MDPKTVIFVLALNLITIGALLALIGRRMDQSQGMRSFAGGAIAFGAGYLLRLATGHQQTSLASVVPDTMMVLSTLLFIVGLRQFVDLSAPRRGMLAAAVMAYALLELAATHGWQDTGRHAMLNAALATNYLLFSVLARRSIRRVQGDMMLSLAVLSGVMGLLGVVTAARVAVVVMAGTAPLFTGGFAAAYYSYSTFVTVALGPIVLWMVFLRLNGRLESLATHDPLTGVLNRRGLDEALQRHFAARPPASLVLCQLDIDHFKRVNDLHGHAAGDAVLRGVAATLVAQVRGTDFVARLGGEEFLVGCVGDSATALSLAERLRQAAAQQRHRHVPGQGEPDMPVPPLCCTVSIGVSPPLGELRHWELALSLADQALYRAKAEGRNTVRVADPMPGWDSASAAGSLALPQSA